MEIWKNIENYEGIYQVSNEGRVKSLKFGKEKLLKPRTNSRGYMCVCLLKDGKCKSCTVHRLVALAFISNPDNKPEVNHKDECKTNNCVENLEWCTRKYNVNYGTHNERMAEAHKGILVNRPDLSIPVDMLSMQGELVGQFPSGKEAERWLRCNGYPKASVGNINKSCSGNSKYTHAYGYKWRYAQKS